MKEIMLICEPPFFNKVDVQVCDFPQGFDSSKTASEQSTRMRCKVTVEFAEADVELLKRQGMSFDEAIEYYEKWLYDVVKLHLASDWECVFGHEELMNLIKERVGRYYNE